MKSFAVGEGARDHSFLPPLPHPLPPEASFPAFRVSRRLMSNCLEKFWFKGKGGMRGVLSFELSSEKFKDKIQWETFRPESLKLGSLPGKPVSR